MVKKLLSVFHSDIYQKWRFASGHSALACLCLFIASSVNAQTTLFADINKTGSTGIQGQISQLVYANGLVFFINDNNVWRSDGTATGTYRLLDDIGLANIDNLTSCGDRVYFTASSYGSGIELWVSTGNGATLMKLNKTSYDASSSPTNLTNINGILYFNATDGISGKEVWKAWGGYQDVAMVADILRGSGGSNPTEFENVNGIVYFTANDGTNGYELWRTDGIAAGTRMVKDVRTGSKLSSSPNELTNVNGTLFFNAYDPTNGRELWKSDGTAAGTLLVKNIRAGSGESIPAHLTAVGSTLYFDAHDGVTGRELWKSNGTAAGTVLVKDITPGAGSNAGGGYPHLSHFTVFNGKLYFMAYTDRPRLWTTDGTNAGTIPISPLDRHFVEIDPNLTVFNGMLYYVTNDNVDPDRGTMEIWKTDGTVANHQHVRSNLGVWINDDMELTAGSDKIYFTTWVVSGGADERLWYTDGTAAGTTEVQSGSNTGSSAPANLTTMGNAIYFSANNGTQWGLFKTDGTTAGTGIVKEIPGPLQYFFTSNNLLYFIQSATYEPSSAKYLWRSDGTEAGTYQLASLGNINTVYDFEAIGNGLVFFKFAGNLWRTNGTVAGTVQLHTFPNPIGWIASAGEELLFAANDGVRGLELWRSNGTVEGTVLQRDIWPGSASALLSDDYSEPTVDAAVSLNNVVYFLANAGGDSNYELWRSDGTGGTGTRLIKNDEIGIPFNPVNGLATAGGRVFLFTYEGRQGDTYIEQRTLWSSDGSTAGTVPIFELLHDEGTGMLNLHAFESGGAHFYFMTTVYLEPATLYASDGTSEGTDIVYQFGNMESAGPLHTAFDGQKTYLSSGHVYDKFVLRSDGTACGTNPVPAYSDASTVDVRDFWLAVLDHQLYLNSHTDQFGEELYRYIDNSYSPCEAATVARSNEQTQSVQPDVLLRAYPNPFVRTLSVTLNSEYDENFAIEVVGADGIPVERHLNLESNTSYEFGDNWRPGIYMVKITRGDQVTTQRIIKRN